MTYLPEYPDEDKRSFVQKAYDDIKGKIADPTTEGDLLSKLFDINDKLNTLVQLDLEDKKIRSEKKPELEDIKIDGQISSGLAIYIETVVSAKQGKTIRLEHIHISFEYPCFFTLWFGDPNNPTSGNYIFNKMLVSANDKIIKTFSPAFEIETSLEVQLGLTQFMSPILTMKSNFNIIGYYEPLRKRWAV